MRIYLIRTDFAHQNPKSLFFLLSPEARQSASNTRPKETWMAQTDVRQERKRGDPDGKEDCQKTGYKQWTQAKDPKADKKIGKYVDLYWSGVSSLLNELRNFINRKIKDVATAYMKKSRAEKG